ncbi:transient-receptor-potential-like protein [Hetaerina americana]|uniref:transient-receptor-potential-like protein n=1 Tax=Hetaerina americana TaxID=62018 RepID=UPI003A7F2E85
MCQRSNNLSRRVNAGPVSGVDAKERTFLEAAERGDRATLLRCLGPPSPVDVNCEDALGRRALGIAVDSENVEVVELLLRQPGIHIGDALLHAITEGVPRIVEMLVDHPSVTVATLAPEWVVSRGGGLGGGGEGGAVKGAAGTSLGDEGSDFSPDVSPIILAAHCNQFEILQLFLSRGAYIEKPHPLSCGCRRCTEGVLKDSLRYSLRRIHTYRALASPAWISLTSKDPILAAFKLSWELERLALVENEFKDTYLELSDQCKRYSCDLLEQCRSTEEVIAVLNRQSNSYGEEDECGPMTADDNPLAPGERLTLSRLKLALKYEQKQFVAHPHCQQLLTSIWYEGFPIWRRRNGAVKVLLCLAIIAAMPFIALTYLLFPRTSLGRLIRSPFMKFIYHSASFGCFLVLLVLASTRTEGTEVYRQNIRGPSPSLIEWLILFWVFGMVWSECKQLWEEGLKAYVRQWWNWLDFIMLSLYLCTFSLRAVAFTQINTSKYGPREMPRSQWPNNDPTLIAEGVFAVANVFSFARIIYLFQTNPHLGPLQISLGCMIIDIAKFLFIFFLVLTSFACGLNQLYWYYDSTTEYCRQKPNGNVECQSNPDAFMTLDVTFATLFWSLFGISSPRSTELVEGHTFIELVGQGMFMAYHVLSIVVLINMLIAMMSNSFQVIEDHADQEWKFARSKLWMSYFDEGCTLPPPFNVIISPKSILYFIQGLARLFQKLYSHPQKIQQHTVNKPTRVQGRPCKGTSSDGPILTNKDAEEYLEKTFCQENNDTGEGKRPSFEEKEDNGSHWQATTQQTPATYEEVMCRLVRRYIHKAKKQMRQDGVSEDDLLEIRQDISSLRYELREDRKRETARAASQVESIKRDMLQALRGIIPSSSTSLHIVHPPTSAQQQQPQQQHPQSHQPTVLQSSSSPQPWHHSHSSQGHLLLLQQSSTAPHPLSHKHSQSVPTSTASSLAPPAHLQHATHLNAPPFLNAIPQQRSVDLGILGSESTRASQVRAADGQHFGSHYGGSTSTANRFSYSHGNLSASPSTATTASLGGSHVFLPRQSSYPTPSTGTISHQHQQQPPLPQQAPLPPHPPSQWDLEQIKSELIASLQAELREALRELVATASIVVPGQPTAPPSIVAPMMPQGGPVPQQPHGVGAGGTAPQATAGTVAPPPPPLPSSTTPGPVLPPGGTHLYQTHLYTQL